MTPGQSVVVQGAREHKFQVPSEAKAGNRIWKHFENEWIDFTVLPIAHVGLDLPSDNTLELTITSGLASETEFMVELDDVSRWASISPRDSKTLIFPRPALESEALKPLHMVLRAGELGQQHKWWLHAKWAGSGNNRLEYAIYESEDDVISQPPWHDSPKLSVADFKSARSAWLRMEVMGSIIGNAVNEEINGVRIGDLPATPSYFSNIRNEHWSPIYIQFPLTAIATLREDNSVVINNPSECVFKARKFWVELELVDGTRLSSRITSLVRKQPPEYFFDSNLHYPTNPYLSEPIRTTVIFPVAD